MVWVAKRIVPILALHYLIKPSSVLWPDYKNVPLLGKITCVQLSDCPPIRPYMRVLTNHRERTKLTF